MLGRTNRRASNTPRKKKIVCIEGFTRRELERAKRARRFYHQMGAQALPQLKLFLRQNMMRNCPVTVTDVNLAE